jgi:nucleotidyltransferase/DNA polymerase involved in DNA repair
MAAAIDTKYEVKRIADQTRDRIRDLIPLAHSIRTADSKSVVREASVRNNPGDLAVLDAHNHALRQV